MKHFYESKTILFNSLTVLFVVATFLGYTPNQELAETSSNLLIALAPIVNIVLRLVTDKKVTL